MKKLSAILAAMSVLAFTAACGGGDGRPSADELSSAFTADDAVVPVPEEYADCVAEELIDSDVSDDTLNAIVEQDADYEGSDDEASKVIDAFTSAQETCVSDDDGASSSDE